MQKMNSIRPCSCSIMRPSFTRTVDAHGKGESSWGHSFVIKDDHAAYAGIIVVHLDLVKILKHDRKVNVSVSALLHHAYSRSLGC